MNRLHLTDLHRLPHFARDFQGNWSRILAQLPGDEKQWHGTRYPRTRLAQKYPWQEFFEEDLATAPETLACIEDFLSGCTYLSDQETRGELDYWERPEVFEKRRTGDCEDHAIWAWRHLHQMGFRVRFVVGHFRTCHAWLHIFTNGRVYLLETTQKKNRPPETEQYKPWWSVERTGDDQFAFFSHLAPREIRHLRKLQQLKVESPAVEEGLPPEEMLEALTV